MPGSGRITGARLSPLAVLLVATTLLCADAASAQVRLNSTAPVDSTVGSGVLGGPTLVPPGGHRPPQPIRDALGAIDVRAVPGPGLARASLQTPAPADKKSVARRVLGGAVGATAGLFAGGYLGAAIEGDRCHCDDPGLKGALIGIPIGAVTGGVLGALFLF
jgi:hypothetical protein